MASKTILGAAALCIAVASFWAGSQYPGIFSSGALGSLQLGYTDQRPPQGFTSLLGTAEVANDGTLSLRVQDGDVRVIHIAETTSITSAPRHISASEVTEGSTISVVGVTESDGSISAQAVQVIPPPPEPAQ